MVSLPPREDAGREPAEAGGAPRASIIVRCYNEAEHIGKLLTGLQAQEGVPHEVIVVDSGSTDGTVEIARSFDVKLVTIPKEDFSFGRSLNLGCAAAGGEFLVFISAHCYPLRTSWLRNLLAPFENPQVACSYGRQRGNGTTRFSEHRIFASWFPEQSRAVQRTPFCNNANAAIRRELWRSQPYDEEITGLEDLDWANRILQRGYHLAYRADAEVVHVHDETPRQVHNRYYREAIAFHSIFPDQSFGLADFLRLFLRNSVADWIAAARQGRLLRNLLDIPRFRLMQFLGTWRGYREELVTAELKQRFYYPAAPSTPPAAEEQDGDLIDYSFAERKVG
jgi:glycosyltransferase involved in cell wall biosynthesis